MFICQLTCISFYFIKKDIKCRRDYPNQNLLIKMTKVCRINPFSYSFSYNDSESLSFIQLKSFRKKVGSEYLFFTIVDEHSFTYLVNLFKIFFIPYGIFSLLTIVFNNKTYSQCNIYHIYCVKIKLPKMLNKLNTTYRKRIWFLKYITFYYFIKNNISILFIDSDIVFIQNCLATLVDNNNDLALLKSQSHQIFGNAGIVYIIFIYL